MCYTCVICVIDVDTHEIDEKSIITYISSLYDVFPEPPQVHPLYESVSWFEIWIDRDGVENWNVLNFFSFHLQKYSESIDEVDIEMTREQTIHEEKKRYDGFFFNVIAFGDFGWLDESKLESRRPSFAFLMCERTNEEVVILKTSSYAENRQFILSLCIYVCSSLLLKWQIFDFWEIFLLKFFFRDRPHWCTFYIFPAIFVGGSSRS